MSITPRVLKEMAAGMAEGPLRTAKTIPLADALFDAAERIEHLNAENARLRKALQDIFDYECQFSSTSLIACTAKDALAEKEEK